MNTINLFNKNIIYKDYDCSKNETIFKFRPPIFNLYIQISDICNASCSFCDKVNCNIKNEFDYEKFKYILEYLYKKDILAGIQITGGEPLLDVKKLNNVLKVIYDVNKNFSVTINTNAFNLNNLFKLDYLNKITEIHVSRHHYEDEVNQKIFNIQVSTLNEIKNFINKSQKNIKFNCVLQNNYIDSSTQIKKYLDAISNYGIKEVRFISMLPLTNYYSKLKTNTTDIINELKNNVNAGNLFDKNICECFSFIHVASNGIPISAFIRNTKEVISPYLRQFVYNSNNQLLTGFNGKIII